VLTWERLDSYAGDYSICIEKLRRGQNDATRMRAAAAVLAGPARAVGVSVGVGVAWRGEAGRRRRRACVPSRDGIGKGFTLHQLLEFTSFLMREIP
jgi:hypothetical protein